MPDLIAEYISFYTSFRSSTRSSSSAPCVYSERRSTLSDPVKRSCCTFSWEMRAGRATRESCGPCEVNQLAHDRIQREVDCSGGDDVKRVVRLVSTGLPDWSLHSRTSKTRLERLRLTPESTNLRLESTDGCVPVARRLRQELFESRASVQASAEP
jgi:hypothetical protein